jgi:magnesium transporter
MNYSATKLEELELEATAELEVYKSSDTVSWIDIQGLGDLDFLKTTADIFNIPVLALEDILHVPQRPKVEEFDGSLLIISAMLRLDENSEVKSEQISIVLSPHCVITFQEFYGDILEPVRKRVRDSTSTLRKSGSDYLAYAVLDTLIDAYYPLLESLGERMEKLESDILAHPQPETLKSIYRVRRELLTLRRILWPQREAITSLIREDNHLLRKSVRSYLRDCYDHCIQAIEVLESYRELCSGLTDLYMSGLSNKLNEVMKVLTIISTLFIPLSFLTGVYGMNFEHMPELSWPWAYPMFWLIIVLIAFSMITFFVKSGWLKPTEKISIKD